MVQIQPVDPHDDPSFRAWYGVLQEGATADRKYPLISSYAAFTSSLRNPGSELRRLAVTASDGDGIVGAMLVELPLKEDLDTVSVEIDVPPAHRRQGVGTELWQWARRFAADNGRRIFQSELFVPEGTSLTSWPGGSFALAQGFTSKNVEDHLVTSLPFDEQLLVEIEGVGGAAGYEIVSWVGLCPEDRLDTLADMYTVMSQDVPTGELSRETQVWDADRIQENQTRLGRNYLAITSLAMASTGAPAGYTEILIPLEDEENVLQESTLVLRRHRGHGLGAMLKAANLRRLAGHEGPRTALHTWTELDNAAMQRVNARFGFRKVETMHEVEL